MVFIYFDGGMITLSDGRKVGVCGATIQREEKMMQFSKLVGVSTEMDVPTAEYQGLIGVLKVYHKAVETGKIPKFESVQIHGDSSLVVNTVAHEYKNEKSMHYKQPHLRPLANEAKELYRAIRIKNIKWVPRLENARADALCNRELGEYRRANDIKMPSTSKYYKSQLVLHGTPKKTREVIYHQETTWKQKANALGYKGSYRGDPRCGNYIPEKYRPLFEDIIDSWNELPPHCTCGLCGQPRHEKPIT